MARTGLLVLGSGSLARALCPGPATVATRELEVSILARDGAAAEELAYLANVSATPGARQARFAVEDTVAVAHRLVLT